MLAIEIIDYGHGSAADRNNNAKLLGTGGLALHIYDPALLIFILLRGMLKSTSRSRDLVMELLHLTMEQPLIWSYDQHTKADSVCFFFSLMRYGSLIPLQRMLNNGCRGTTLEPRKSPDTPWEGSSWRPLSARIWTCSQGKG